MKERFIKAALVVFTLLIFMFLIPSFTLAFEPPWLEIEVPDAPSEVKYLDILIPKDMPEIHMNYINKYMLDTYPQLSESELARLNSGGFVSYSLYFHDANPVIEPYRQERIWRFAQGHIYLIKNLKIVTLNGEAEILQISDVVNIGKPDFLHLGGIPSIRYYNESNSTEVIFKGGLFPVPFTIGILLIVCGIPAFLLSILVEVLIALPFRIKPFKIIPLINLGTQSVVAFAMPFLTVLMPFAAALAISALLAAVVELLVYRKAVIHPKGWKMYIYILSANLISTLINFWIYATWVISPFS